MDEGILFLRKPDRNWRLMNEMIGHCEGRRDKDVQHRFMKPERRSYTDRRDWEMLLLILAWECKLIEGRAEGEEAAEDGGGGDIVALKEVSGCASEQADRVALDLISVRRLWL